MLVLNLVGTKVVAAAQSAIVFCVLGVFVVFICATLPNIDTSLLASSGYPSFAKIVSSVALTFFAYLGFNVITFTGGDLRNPQRDIPRATYLSIGITAVSYVLIAIGVFGTLTVTEVISYGETAIAEAARPTLGDAGFTIMAVVALLSTAGATNATLYASGNLTACSPRRGSSPSSSAAARAWVARRGLLITTALSSSSRISSTSRPSPPSAAPSRSRSSSSSASPAGSAGPTREATLRSSLPPSA